MINPILLDIGPIHIRYYGLLYALAFLIGYFILIKLSPKFNIKKNDIEDYVPYIIIGDLIGGRLFEILFYSPSYYFANPLKMFAIWEGGISSHGAIISMILITIWFCRKRKISFYNFSDLVSIPVMFGAALIRIGNFINSELVGKVTSLPWAVQFPGYEGLRHPVQLYQAGYHLIIFGILLLMLKLKNKEKGTIFWSMLFLDSLFRFITEFYKDLPLNYGFNYLGFNLAQYASIIIILISIIPLYNRIKIYFKNNKSFEKIN